MSKITVLVGLPRSGKSTYCLNKKKAAIVSRDCIRIALHGHIYRQESETMVTAIEDTMVRSLMLSDTNEIIIDATNTIPAFRNKWRRLAMQFGYDIVFKCFKTPENVCYDRAIRDDRDDLISTIEKMSGYITFPGKNADMYEMEPV